MNSSSTELTQLLTATNSSLGISRYIASGRTPRKTRSSVVPYCFRRVHLSVDVLLLRALAPTGMCLARRCLAMDLYITIYTRLHGLTCNKTVILINVPRRDDNENREIIFRITGL
jgi:hypothetical protein